MSAAVLNVDSYTLTLLGAPRTKKTSNRLTKKIPGKRQAVLPSEAWEWWLESAVFRPPLHGLVEVQAACWRGLTQKQRAGLPRPRTHLADPPAGFAWNCNAQFFCDADRVVDSHGLYNGLADLLQDRGLISNDRHLRWWDGSDVHVDPKNPRVEVTLTLRRITESAAKRSA